MLMFQMEKLMVRRNSNLPNVPLFYWTGLLKLFQRSVPLATLDLEEPCFFFFCLLSPLQMPGPRSVACTFYSLA